MTHNFETSIYMYCLKCGCEMTCLGIAKIDGDIIAVDYSCDNCGASARMELLIKRREP